MQLLDPKHLLKESYAEEAAVALSSMATVEMKRNKEQLFVKALGTVYNVCHC